MSHLPGNPHYDDATGQGGRMTRQAGDIPTAQAMYNMAVVQVNTTLALAYEQRTANLIATQALGVTDMTEWLPEHSKLWLKRAEEIGTRLGEIE